MKTSSTRDKRNSLRNTATSNKSSASIKEGKMNKISEPQTTKNNATGYMLATQMRADARKTAILSSFAYARPETATTPNQPKHKF